MLKCVDKIRHSSNRCDHWTVFLLYRQRKGNRVIQVFRYTVIYPNGYRKGIKCPRYFFSKKLMEKKRHELQKKFNSKILMWCKCCAIWIKENRNNLKIRLLRFLGSDPGGARTLDPLIKSQLL
ncbi:MAG: hypothetical protein J1E99_08780, partial [Muribaculaceae bacterium]|nr:hypothetical protein [Muribaculaceae bacterium]